MLTSFGENFEMKEAQSVDGDLQYFLDKNINIKTKPSCQKAFDREFENIRNNPIVQNVMFEKSQNVRFVKIEPIETADNSGIYTVAEFGIIIK